MRTDTHSFATLPRVTASTSPAAIAVESRLFHALAVLRIVVLANTLALSAYRFENFQRPVRTSTIERSASRPTAMAPS